MDASAILAILLGEPDADRFAGALEGAGGLMSPVNHWEVLARAHAMAGPPGAVRAEELMSKLGVRVATISADASRRAYEAFARFGRGVGGPLNVGDCFAYALAETEGDGLLFKGDDFPRTDIRPAIS